MISQYLKDMGKKMKPSLFRVEQYLNGELNTAESRDFESLMASDPDLKSFVQSQSRIRYEGFIPAFQSAKIQAARFSQPSVFSEWRRKMGERFSPVFPPPVAWAMGLCLLAGAVLVLFRPERLEYPVQDFTAKGSSAPFHLRVGAKDFQPEQSGFVKAGDTMSFVYRSLTGAHVQIWYQDDGGEIKPYLAPTSGASSWAGTSTWRQADYKVVLFSDWNKESIWVLWSDQDFGNQEARKVLEGGRGGEAIQKVAFHLVRTP